MFKYYFYNLNGKATIEGINSVEINDVDDYFSNKSITDYTEISQQDLEALSDYRDGLIISNGELVPDMALLLDKKIEKIRIDREEKLKQLDVDFIRLLETNSDTDAVIAQKNALRDLPATVAAMTFDSVDDLIAYWPAELS